ncbi:MAG TPA: UDP-glucose--hexose-1-phosphate uridylyltransferase [Terriglobales bacterium]|nr:UDP-glucose--hexose-1-phosphate uridylyltransferase [Terriglobales bacterium]
MLPQDLATVPHRRLNPLTGDWILVSPHRTQRPWQGQTEKRAAPASVAYDPSCYLCPGNERAGGHHNPKYESTLVFTNDFAALVPDSPETRYDVGGLLVAQGEAGTCRVICFSPRHDLTLARMSVEEIHKVVDLWVEQYAELGARPRTNYVQIFENRGEIMGCSNPHPHCQIWTNEIIPNEPRKEQERQSAYALANKSCLLCDYLLLEKKEGTRIVCENDDFVALVPFWATWPFETLLLAKSHVRDLPAMSSSARSNLADILKRLTTRYDNLFEISFPYSMGFHQAPTDGEPHNEWHLHAHFYPPLLRSATIRKFMVGYELLAMPQRDITPELAAERLRNLSEQHYSERS